MFDVDAIPCYAFKLTPDGDGWLTRNPITDTEYELNQPAYWVLRLCDGYRTWGENVAELERMYQTERAEVISFAEPLLHTLTEEGLLWWRDQRMQRWQQPPPMAVLWDLTSGCNLSCRHCVVSAGTHGDQELSLEECCRVIDELAAFGVQQLILSGGEPLMRRDFFEIVEHAADQGLSLQIATNGTLVTEQVAERLAAIGAEAQVSLDGATPEVHDGFRQVPGSWERTVRGIKHLVAAGVSVMAAAVVTKMNVAQIPMLYEFAAELGADTFRILPFVPCGRGQAGRELEVSPKEMRKVTDYLRVRRDQGGLPVASMEFECTFSSPPQARADPQTRIGCDGAVAYCTITSSGEVLPCNFFAGAEAWSVKEKPFAWIWENSRFLNYFRSLKVSDIQGACQDCAWLPVCRGSCIAANFAHGDVFQSNCHCWLAAEDAASQS